MSVPTARIPSTHPTPHREAPSRQARSESAQLGREDELRLVRRAQAGDREALERLIRAHTGLIFRTARRYRCRTYSLEDLVQEGIVGFTVAIGHFEPDRGHRLCTYALFWIRQSIARAAEQNDRIIHLPANLRPELRRVIDAAASAGDTGRTVDVMELAGSTGLSEERIVTLLRAVPDALSLEALASSHQDSSFLDIAVDPSAPDPEHLALRGELREEVRRLVHSLQPRERTILAGRFGIDGEEPRTLDQLSQKLRLSRERVRQIEVAALRKLRSALVDWV